MVIVVGFGFGFGLALGWDPQLTFVHGVELAGLMILGILAFHVDRRAPGDAWCVIPMAICVPVALRRFNRTLAA